MERVVETWTREGEKVEANLEDVRDSRGRFLPGVRHGPGAQPGKKQKLSLQLQSMVHEALELQPGGAVRYLAEQAQANPRAFLALLGKLIPRDLHVTQEGPTLAQMLAESYVKQAAATVQEQATERPGKPAVPPPQSAD